MNIIPPAAPQLAIRVVDGDTVVGILDGHAATEADRLLHRIRDTFPNSTLAEYDGDGWIPVDDQHLKSTIYQHTMYVLWFLMGAGLPLAHWDLAPWRPGKLEGTLHRDSIEEARKALEAYAEVFGVDEIREQASEHAFTLHLSEVVWGGVKVELSTYTTVRQPRAGVEPAAAGSAS